MVVTPDLILKAYREGLFPMGDPYTGVIEWFRPDPRAVLPLEKFHCPRRLARTVRSGKFEIATDRDFEGVIDGCADRDSTWITPPVRTAYLALHRGGHAHSVEAWRKGKLAGGLYGVHIGGAFMAESMYHRETDAGKVALVGLVTHMRERGFALLDIQMVTPILRRFGGTEIPHAEYVKQLKKALRLKRGWKPFRGEVSCQGKKAVGQ